MPSGEPLDRRVQADQTLEALQALRRHAGTCRQCRLSPEFCDTRKRYEEGFERDYANWERLPTPPKATEQASLPAPRA